jgi:hypothetical protein
MPGILFWVLVEGLLLWVVPRLNVIIVYTSGVIQGYDLIYRSENVTGCSLVIIVLNLVSIFVRQRKW